MTELKARYDATPIPPKDPMDWDRTWVDRCRTWEGFLAKGPLAAYGFTNCSNSGRGELRTLAPELFDLVVAAFPPPAA